MFKKTLYWFIASTVFMIGGFLLFDKSLLSDMVVFIFIISGIAALYIAKKTKEPKALTKKDRYAYILIGLFVCAFSFINYFIGPKFFFNSPFSLGSYGMLLSGLSIVLFALLGYKELIIPSSLPAIVLFFGQIYDRYRNAIDVIAVPLLGPTTEVVTLILNLIGIKATSGPTYIIQFMTQTGILMNIQIVVDCTGVWSLSAFTASLLIVSIAFPKLFSKENAKFILVGYIGTYAANILRVVAICVSGYLYGYSGVVETTHKHAGWVAFSGWMLIFWTLFFSRKLLKKVENESK